MTPYKLTMVAYVCAESESAARQMWIDGVDPVHLVAVDESHAESCDMGDDCSCCDEAGS